MNALTKVQIIEQNGQPAFAVLPWDTYQTVQKLIQREEKLRTGIPQEVVELSVLHDMSMIVAWREYLGLSQSEVARKAGMKQPALSRIERNITKPRPDTIRRIADAMGIHVEQLCL